MNISLLEQAADPILKNTNFIALAMDAVTVFTFVVVVPAAFAVGTIAIGSAVQTVATMSSRIVQGLVEVASAGISVTVAS